MKTKLTVFLAALLLWTALPLQAQFHAELGYRYGLGLNEQMLGECVYRDQYKMYSNTILLNFMYDITPQMSAGAGVGFTLCETGSHGSLPIYATFRYSPLKKVPGFYAFTDLGYAPPIGPGKTVTWSMGQEQTRYEGLNYGHKPKGLVTFHAYPEGARKAVEEHLVEGASYASSNGVARIHFTVSPEHMEGFKTLLAEKVPVYEKRFGIRYDISFSVQKPATDTIAVNPDNTPFRQDDGRLLFRPAGHGALIENLNEIDADVIFIKNIDNVTTDAQRGDTIRYKKVLAGVLLDLQEQAFEYLRALDVEGCELAPIAEFIEKRLCVKLPADYDSALLRAVLDRPIRVCGMVRNEGEPGGGPFWVGNPDGTESLQIAESSQIGPDDQPLMKSATHFNPVDLVCGVRTSKGGKFDLRQYTDPSTGFISSKSSGGRDLRAQELPGLWNGAMARWNTVFVDVPITTFSPVKVVQDLLRPQHQ